MITIEKIARLREQMKRLNLAAFIIPSSDPHLSEYVAPHWKSREWLSGFTGSAGTLS
jgi:Xaa-Pro aminopeptidase